MRARRCLLSSPGASCGEQCAAALPTCGEQCAAEAARLWGMMCRALLRLPSCAAPMLSVMHTIHPTPPQTGDQHGNIRVWDLTANACSCELVPEVGTGAAGLRPD